MTSSDLGVLAIRAVVGGAVVVLFALIGEVTKPKTFAGLFAASPAVAIASLAVTAIAEGGGTARKDAVGMTVGGIGMGVCCVVAVIAVPRLRAVRGSLAAWVAWTVVALGLYWAVFIGAQ